MEDNSNDSFANNNLFKNLTFERNSNKFCFGISRTLWNFLFIKICIFFIFYIILLYELKAQRIDIKNIVSFIKKIYQMNNQ
jgi:hypothetical protein